jgi:hypothetical protein
MTLLRCIDTCMPIEMLGHSSTAREIKGVTLAAERLASQLEGQRVRICMDSYPAIRNFINGGGPKDELNAMVKEWWIWCKMRQVTPLYLWIPREDNSLADELSKQAALTHALKPEAEQAVRKWLITLGEPGMDRNHWLQTRVQCPLFDRIAIRVQEMRRSRRPACIVLPAWKSAVWRAELHAYSTQRMRLGSMRAALVQEAVASHDGWELEAHLIMPKH